MALSRRNGQKMNGSIWPGFVDAMTALLLVLMFVLSIFMIVQSVLRETIDTQDHELDSLTAQVAGLADALGLERNRADSLADEVGQLGKSLTAAQTEGATQAALAASLSSQLIARQADLATATARISSFEQQVASLLAERDAARGQAETLTANVADLEAAQNRMISEQEALNLAVARARDEIDAQAEAARLAAARREALDALVADLKTKLADGQASLADTLARLTEAEGKVENRGAELAALAARLGAATDAQIQTNVKAEALAAEVARLQKDLLLAQAASQDAQALRNRMATLEASLSEAEKNRLAELAAAEALRNRLKGAETSLTQEQAALLAERAAAEALRARLEGVETKLTAEEEARLADLAAAEALRAKLAASETELTAMTLALEDQRKRAEETLTLLAAAQIAANRSGAEVTGKDALLATARAALAKAETKSEDNARRVALLNEQIAALRGQLGDLQGLLDASAAKDQASDVRLDSLGTQLNTALAQVAAEQKRRAELEEAERKRLLAETKRLETFRSEFFGQLRSVLAGREGVRIVGDRFVFSSEVLFQPGSATLAPEGRRQIAGVVETLREVSGQIPAGIDWIIRVDGHTDDVPLSGAGAFADNWELSQARALSVVRFMQNDLGFPPNRMAATGFGEWQPVAAGDSETARAQNRRIELKLTER
jgi:chemotaxis protein MotB